MRIGVGRTGGLHRIAGGLLDREHTFQRMGPGESVVAEPCGCLCGANDRCDDRSGASPQGKGAMAGGFGTDMDRWFANNRELLGVIPRLTGLRPRGTRCRKRTHEDSRQDAAAGEPGVRCRERGHDEHTETACSPTSPALQDAGTWWRGLDQIGSIHAYDGWGTHQARWPARNLVRRAWGHAGLRTRADHPPRVPTWVRFLAFAAARGRAIRHSGRPMSGETVAHCQSCSD